MNTEHHDVGEDLFFIKDFIYSCITVFGLVLISPAIAYLIWIG